MAPMGPHQSSLYLEGSKMNYSKLHLSFKFPSKHPSSMNSQTLAIEAMELDDCWILHTNV